MIGRLWEGGREGGREGGKEGGREGGREGGKGGREGRERDKVGGGRKRRGNRGRGKECQTEKEEQDM